MESLDPELQAMASVASTLGELDAESQSRVLRWAADKFSVTLSSKSTAVNVSGEDKDQPRSNDFADFVDLLYAVKPSSNLEKALTGAYWVQVVQGAASWQSQQVNSILKDTNNGVASIVDALDSAQSKTPALVLQMAKSGRSRQARKTFKLTTAGIKFITTKISGDINTPGEE